MPVVSGTNGSSSHANGTSTLRQGVLHRAGADGAHALPRGRAVQVDPTKPMLKVPGCARTRLKLGYDELVSTFAFNFNLRRYRWVVRKRLMPATFGAGGDNADVDASLVSPGMDIYVAGGGGGGSGRGKKVGKVVTTQGGVGLVMLRLSNVASGAALVAVGPVGGEGAGEDVEVAVKVTVPEWWHPNWITDACQ